MISLSDLTAVALLDGYAKRQLSPVDVMRAVIARVEACEPKLHATYLFASERALEDARRSEARWLNGEALGPLDGAPVRVKILRCALAEGAGASGQLLDDHLALACGEGSLRILELQRAGGKPMKAEEFLRGTPLKPPLLLA